MNATALLIIAIIGVSIAASLRPKKQSRLIPLSQLKVQPRRLLTAREQQMFFRLTETLTDCTVFPQMPLAALLTTADFQDRNRYNRKIADFLICTKTLTPIAVIELDDVTHDKKIAQDADRDAMLRNAGYQTLRYREFPSSAQLRQDIENAFKKAVGLTRDGDGKQRPAQPTRP